MCGNQRRNVRPRLSAMSCGLLPPLLDLIPTSTICKSPTNSKSQFRECAPYATQNKVMGEQRSRRTTTQTPVDLIDTVRSRGLSAASQAPSRKTRSERHRKLNRRREHRGGRKRSASKLESQITLSSPERPVNPRVNPIFVWVRQEDTHIVDVKCEDYDKRNRILLTKTAQGWRAIPRTETLVPSLKEEAEPARHRIRKARRASKIKRKSTAIQVDPDTFAANASRCVVSPTWSIPVNVESHLPSHTIHIPKKRSPSPEESRSIKKLNVNSVTSVNFSAQTPVVKCCANKISDVSPLDNLLAVAELEFNHQMQSGEWNASDDSKSKEAEEDIAETTKSIVSIDDDVKESTSNSDDLNCFLGYFPDNKSDLEKDAQQDLKVDECDYNEDDENNLAMDDILSRLEQSLQSPDITCPTAEEAINNNDNSLKKDGAKKDRSENVYYEEKQYNCNTKVPDLFSSFQDEEKSNSQDLKTAIKELLEDLPVEISTFTEQNDEEPTDLTIPRGRNENLLLNTNEEDMMPTDLSIPKDFEATLSPRILTPRPSSNHSETIQSPQPSGIPAVPPSPDAISTTFTNSNKTTSKSIFLETLLSSTSHVSQSPKARQKEPLDLGKCRKSASPTISCSEEVKNVKAPTEENHLSTKYKGDAITLKKLLDDPISTEYKSENKNGTAAQQVSCPESSRLLELLISDSEPEPITQLKQILADSTLNVPDPMLVPKDRLSRILSSPGTEIPRLLIQRPELRLPEAFAYPHLLQDPDILVITLSQLETIIQKQNQPLPLSDEVNASDHQEKARTSKVTTKRESDKKPSDLPQMKEAALKLPKQNTFPSDSSSSNNNMFNQMMWLPYLQQLEATSMAFGTNPDLFKILNSVFPAYSGQMQEMPFAFGVNKFPTSTNFPSQNPFNCSNPLEYSMWQEAALQANLLKTKNSFDSFNGRGTYREYLEKITLANSARKYGASEQRMQSCNKKNYMPSPVYPQNLNSISNLRSPLFGGAYQPPNMRHNLQVPQYNPFLPHKNHSHKNVHNSAQIRNQFESSYFPKTTNNYHHSDDSRHGQKNLHSVDSTSKAKKSTDCSSKKKSCNDTALKTNGDLSMQPIDLSGATVAETKLKIKHLVDLSNTPKLIKNDDIPEVGSTTSTLEEINSQMHETQKNLWHPLFGSQKGYNNPWNWTTVAATGE